MRAFGLFCCLLMTLVLPARSTTYVTFDGAWWSGLTYAEKVAAVEGMFAAYDGAFHDGVGSGALETANRMMAWIKSAHLGKAQLPAELAIMKAASLGFPYSSVSSGLSYKETFDVVVKRLDGAYAGAPGLVTITPVLCFLPCASSDSGDCSEMTKWAARPSSLREYC
jgi:hypothetical protein